MTKRWAGRSATRAPSRDDSVHAAAGSMMTSGAPSPDWLLLAQQLHDSVGQDLALVRLDIALARRQLQADLESVEQRLLAAEEVVDRIVRTVHDLALGMRARVAVESDLIVSLTRAVDEIQQRSGLEFHVDLPPRVPRLTAHIREHIARIATQALANIVLHAAATRVTLRLEVGVDTLVLTVIDDGVGIPRDVFDSPEALGLRGMYERAAAIGALLSFSNESPHGTRVTLRLSPPALAAEAR